MPAQDYSLDPIGSEGSLRTRHVPRETSDRVGRLFHV